MLNNYQCSTTSRLLDSKFQKLPIEGRIKLLSESINCFTQTKYTLIEVNGSLPIGINMWT